MATTTKEKAALANGAAPELSAEPLEPVAMSAAVVSALREPFRPEQVGKLPRITCGDCSKASGKVCAKHEKKRCGECGSWITTAHIHLDYVGHAAATDRLLTVDPFWTWEPFAYDVDGLPAFDAHGGMWIKLTIAGVTRPGYGDQTNGKGVKEVIGDAIRNGAMRFGVALDLWSKEDLHADRDPGEAPDSAAAPRERTQEATAGAGKGRTQTGAAGAQNAAQSSDERPISEPQRGRVWGIARDAGLNAHEMHEVIGVIAGVAHVAEIPRKSMDAVTSGFFDYAADKDAGRKVIEKWREGHAELAAEIDAAEGKRLAESEGGGDDG